MESHCFSLPCERPDWNKISMLIGKLFDVRSIKEASDALLAIARRVHGAESASTPHHLIEKFLFEGASKDEQCKIVQTVLPVLAKAAQSVNKFKLKESWQTYREINETGSSALTSTVSSEFLVSLMANCVLCTIPLPKQVTVHPLVSFLSSFERSRDVMYEKLRCVFKFFEDIGTGHSTCLGKVVFKLKVDAMKRDKDPNQHVLKLKTTEHTNKGMCLCPLLLPASLLLPPIGANDVIEISGIRDGVVVKGHALNLTIIEEPSSIGQEEQDSDYHDANDQSDVSVESDYETAPETNDNFLSPYELVSGYSNSLSKAITNCAIYDAVRTNKLRRSSDDSRSSQNSSNSSNQSNAREQAGFTEAGQLAHNLAQYYSQDTDRLHVNLLRRRSSNELSSHHSTSLSEFGSEMDEYFGKKISAINEDDSQHVEEFAATLACSVVSHGLNTASLLVPGIQQFEAKQPVNVAMRPIALRPTPESITPELSSDDTSSQVNSVEQLADNVVEQSISLIFSSSNGKLNSAERVTTATANGFQCCGGGVKKKISYKKIEKLASNLVEKLINEVMLKKKSKINTEETCRQQIFNEKERASFVEAVDDLAGHVVELALQDAQDIINDRLDLDSFGSVNEEEYSIISSMSSMKESDSYEIIKIDSLSDASSSPVIVTKKSFSAEECVDKILTDSFVELGNMKCGTRDKNDVHNSHFDVNAFSQMVIEAALQKLNELKSSNGSRRNLGDLGCLATSSTICCDQSKVIGNGLELFRQNHKLELPEPTTNIVHDKVSEGNLISTQETIGRNVKYIKTKFDRNTQAFMSDTSENRLSGENSGPTPGTPPPTPDYLTKNNFENNQHALEEELRKRFAIEETDEETKPKITSIDSLASKLASAAVSDGIHKETEGAGPKITSIDSLASKLASAAVSDGIYKETEGAGPKITSIDSLASKLASAAVSDGIHKVCRREKKPSSASTFTEDLLKIGNIDITGKRPSCTEENIAIFREELRRASIEQERELARRGSQLSDFADELESTRFKEEIPNHIQEFAYDLANNILASAFRQQFGDIEKNNDSESTVDRQQPGAVSLDTAAQERNLLAMATNLANSIVASALQALRSQASGRSTSADRSPHSP
ncbi:uncharacterized protein [Antedon mediterranea]|uniref:uncharacterized protein n=1 Tax=Antedon mediterranea TaxID=105859 RepID=UPI003AF73B40